MEVIEAVARILKTEGVEWISCFPNNQLIEAVAKEGIRPSCSGRSAADSWPPTVSAV